MDQKEISDYDKESIKEIEDFFQSEGEDFISEGEEVVALNNKTKKLLKNINNLK